MYACVCSGKISLLAMVPTVCVLQVLGLNVWILLKMHGSKVMTIKLMPFTALLCSGGGHAIANSSHIESQI